MKWPRPGALCLVPSLPDEPVRELLHDRLGERIGDHRHVPHGLPQVGVDLRLITRGLGVDDVLQR